MTLTTLLRITQPRCSLSSAALSTSVRSRTNIRLSEEKIERYCPGGYHPVRIGDLFNNGKYEVVSKLGWGMYSTVWLVRDKVINRHVALKVLTADTYGGKKDSFEVSILEHIGMAEAASPGAEHVLGLLDQFTHQGPNGQHVCLVFKAVGPDMTTYQRQFPQRRLPIKMVKQVSRQLLMALQHLHESCRVIHTDIKPQNILAETSEINEMFQYAPSDVFKEERSILDCPDDFYMKSQPVASHHEDLADPTGFMVRLSDFGTASWFDKHLTEWIQPESLRAPEVILQAGWSTPVDIWNLGCVLYELAEGKVLFEGRANPSDPYTAVAHLAQMQNLLGPMPADLISRSRMGVRYYNQEGILTSASTFPDVSLDTLIARPDLLGEEKSDFIIFLEAMLRLDPEQRCSARDLLEYRWVRNGITDSNGAF